MTTPGTTTKQPVGLITVIRWVFGVYFIGYGIVHFVLPEGLPSPLSWMYDMSTPLHVAAGTAEILGGLGLILPRLTGIQPRLTIAAAVGLALVMLGAAAWHFGREEWPQLAGNLVVAILMMLVARHEWLRPD